MYEIEIQPSGLCDVRKDRRAFLYDMDDVEEAVRLIRQRDAWVDPHEIVVIEPDGYRTTLDRHR